MPLATTPTNDLTFTLQSSLSLGGAEISAFDPGSDRLFVTSSLGLQVVNLADPVAPGLITTVNFTTLGFATTDVTSVAVKNGIVAVALPNADKSLPGKVVFLNAADHTLLGSVDVGALPDMLTFTPDGTKVLVANENEIVSDANFGGQGSVSIIDISGGVGAATVQTAGFTAFNGQEDALRAEGVRIFAGKTVSEDVEPEYIAVSADGAQAMVTLQEANAVAVLDIATATFTDIVPLGTKDFSGLLVDTSDQDGTGGAASMKLQVGDPVFGLYMPDAIDSYQAGGETYYVIANEGDDRNDFLNPDEAIRLSSGSYDLDNAVFTNESTLKAPAELGRLTISNAPGLRGDTDGDGDIDQILMYGGRSFSILDSDGNIVFDSADIIERIVASEFPALFDDTRSDNKGPEPEGIEIASIGGDTYALVGLERSHLTLAFDITDPGNVTYTGAAQRAGDLNPEGGLFISRADSPTGQALFVTSNEVSNNISVFEVTDNSFTLQLLHYYGESGMLGTDTAPIMGALIDKFDDEYANTLVLAEGDSYIPGPWLVGGADPSLNPVPGIGATALGRPDIAIMNAFGTDASALGNHEFDLGSPVLQGAVQASGAWAGAQFPFITANLNFSADSALRGLADATLGGTATNDFAGDEASTIKGKIAPYTVVTQGGEKIGVIGITTFELLIKTSPNGTVPKDDGNPATTDMQEVAAYVQGAVDALTAAGVNKIVMLDQLDTLARNQELAPLVHGVDVMVAGGGHERLGDANDTAVGFNGHTADFFDTYPIVTAGFDGKPTLIVTTDTEYTYLGRLVVDFDADGEIILSSLDSTINGAYASTEANLQAAYGSTDTADQIVAGSTIGARVDAITDGIEAVIAAKDGELWGFTSVYLEGDRAFGRAQEVNLGDISADANLHAAAQALDSDFVVSLKNGGGIRASIGSIDEDGGKIAPIANPDAGKPAGAISTLDIENALRFDNKLMVFDTTAQGLKNILEHGTGLAPGNGGYPQIGGLQISYVPDNAPGSKVRNVAVIDLQGEIIARIIEDGVVSPDAPATISMVSLNFTANGGDGYPIKVNAENFRYLLNDGTLSAPVSEALDFTAAANVPANALGEQQAFKDFLQEFHATPETAYEMADTPVSADERIQNLNAKAEDTVFDGETIVGGEGRNALEGTAGDDTLDGGAGNDRLFGEEGDDTLIGGDGHDALHGGSGNDLLYGDSVNVALSSRNGSHSSGGGNDKLEGGSGNDTLIGGAGNDGLEGDDGDDLLDGGSGNDELDGGSGNDELYGDSGNDKLEGGSGNDGLYGDSGNDKLEGGSGNDTLVGGSGHDRLSGGPGQDIFIFDIRNYGSDRIKDFSPGEDMLDLQGLGPAGFGTLDSNHDGVLNGRDRLVDLDDDSLVLTLHGGEITLDGVCSLGPTDFIL
jgi:2',3'-cyclic-nucleotide 2'-phosphodiesterase (5'-nucleotidase family)